MDRLTSMQVFVEVAEKGGLTAAADSLGMSRAMIDFLAERFNDNPYWDI